MANSKKSGKVCAAEAMPHPAGAEAVARPLPRSAMHAPAGDLPVTTAIDEFKRQLSRDLHDDCGQIITLLQLRLAMLQTSIPPEHPDLGAQAVQITHLVAKLSLQLHTLCSELRQPVQPTGGLIAGLRTLVGETKALLPELHVNLNTSGLRDENWPAIHHEELYHVCKEALTNALRHAGARRLDIALQQAQDALLLTVSDDGTGFVPGPQPFLSQGLAGMRERLERLGGSLQIESGAGEGTTVHGRIPLPEASDG